MRVNEIIHGAHGYTGSAPLLGFEPFAYLTLGLWCVVVRGVCQTKKLKMAVYRETLCSFGIAALRRTLQMDLKGCNAFPNPQASSPHLLKHINLPVCS